MNEEAFEFAKNLIAPEDFCAIDEKMGSFGNTPVTAKTIIELVVYTYWLGYCRSISDREEVDKENEQA